MRLMVGRRCCGLQRSGHEAVVKLLLEKGAELEAKDETNGQTMVGRRCYGLQRRGTRRW